MFMIIDDGRCEYMESHINIKTSYYHNITFDGLFSLFIYVEYRNIMLHKHDMVDDNMDTIMILLHDHRECPLVIKH